MSRAAVVPLATIARRIPEAGRIRIGVKAPTSKGGERPKAIGEFRFTSHDRAALEQIAGMYGGAVKPWSDPKAAEGQYEVITSAPEIRVVLPPDPLGGSPVYELWGGGGCERRCDGITATVLQQGPDGLEPTDVACLCAARGELSCSVTTRLSVILPEVRFAGVWRLDTKSWNAAQELPGMVDLIQQMQGRGLSYAVLAVKHRRSVFAGETRRFMVPVLGVGASIEELAAGQARLGSIGAGDTVAPVGELGPGEVGAGTVVVPASSASAAGSIPATEVPPPPDPDDEITDAELVDEPEPSRAQHAPTPIVDGGISPMATRSQITKLQIGCSALGMTTKPKRLEWATVHVGRPVESFNALTLEEASLLIDLAEDEIAKRPPVEEGTES